MENENKLDIQLPNEVASGKYANLAVISHSQSEFIIDFATMLPGLNKAVVGSRIIMTPEHAKRLMLALKDNVDKYESQFGNISFGRNETFPMGGFGGNNGAKS